MAALDNEPLTIYGDGKQTRSFCFVRDLIEALLLLMNSPDNVTGPVNLGNPVESEISQLAELIIELSGSNSEIIYEEALVNDPRRRKPDISRAKELLDWSPKITLEEGLENTIAYFDKLLSGEEFEEESFRTGSYISTDGSSDFLKKQEETR